MEVPETERERTALPNGSSDGLLVGPLPYDFEVDMNSDSTHAKVVRLVGTNKRVLDLGCASGYLARVLQNRGCVVVGVELDHHMAEKASAFCEKVVVADLDQPGWDGELGDDNFDVVVAADVLEHLKSPLSVLRTLRRLIRPDGYLVASIPNIAHGSVRLALLNGHFPYSKLGLLDASHLRFYTWETAQKLFEDADFVIGDVTRQMLKISASEVPYETSGVPDMVIDRLSSDPDALTYQFILTALPLPRSDLRVLRQRIDGLVTEREAALQEADSLRRTIEEQARRLEEQTNHLDELSRTVAGLVERKESMRVRLLEAHDQLLRRDEDIAEKGQLIGRLETENRELTQRMEQVNRTKDEHIADLQNALDRILYSRPGKAYRFVRDIVTGRN